MRRIVRMTGTCCRVFVAIGALFGMSLCCFGETLRLENEHMLAEFGGRGLTEITHKASKQTIHISQDEFALTVEDNSIDSERLVPVKEDGGKGPAYIYRASGCVIRITYELKEQEQFLTKRLEIIECPGSEYTIGAVEPVRLAIREQIRNSFTPTGYTPQFGRPQVGTPKTPAKDFGTFLRLNEALGLMLLVQNPFLEIAQLGQAVSVRYQADMRWRREWGLWSSDLAVMGVYSQSGKRIPAEMTYEWESPKGSEQPGGADLNEIQAFTDCLRRFLVQPSSRPISVEVGWTLNDYQIDVATAEGRAEYKRVIDTASQLGIESLLYGPANSALANKSDDADAWDWEHVLWLGMGQQIRSNKWNIDRDPIPASITEMLGYAKSKKMDLVAYVYPSLPFAQNLDWLVTDPNKTKKNSYATLSSREFQDYLIRELLAFKKRTGIRGYSFDYAFLNLPGSSPYSQWWGWRRVLEALRRAEPSLVIDGRQSYQLYGPWSWLAGNYPHPTGNDEQPESFTPFPDLHFDRVSGDRVRFVNYWYRNYQFAPEEIIPGYMTHQTPRNMNLPVVRDSNDELRSTTVYSNFRARDWDYLGFKYSVLSSIATGGWNNVVDMIPGRDLEEFRNFSETDKKWIRGWLEWTAVNKSYLRNTRTILSQPAIDRTDGTSAIIGEQGFLFLFNPNYKTLPADFELNASIGLEPGEKFVLREVYPQSGKLIGKLSAGLWTYGDKVHLDMLGTSAMVLELVPAAEISQRVCVFGATSLIAARPLRAAVENGVLRIDHVAGQYGDQVELGALLQDPTLIREMRINGRPQVFRQEGRYISAKIRFEGRRFAHSQELTLNKNSDGSLTGSFSIPGRIKAQLMRRRERWPIPWTNQDYETTWLVPERLLMFIQIAQPNDAMDVSVRLDGSELKLKRAYSSVRVHPPSFVGFYGDMSDVRPEIAHTIQVRLPKLEQGQFKGIFFDNVETELTEELVP
jgi:hypothetical protein